MPSPRGNRAVERQGTVPATIRRTGQGGQGAAELCAEQERPPRHRGSVRGLEEQGAFASRFFPRESRLYSHARGWCIHTFKSFGGQQRRGAKRMVAVEVGGAVRTAKRRVRHSWHPGSDEIENPTPETHITHATWLSKSETLILPSAWRACFLCPPLHARSTFDGCFPVPRAVARPWYIFLFAIAEFDQRASDVGIEERALWPLRLLRAYIGRPWPPHPPSCSRPRSPAPKNLLGRSLSPGPAPQRRSAPYGEVRKWCRDNFLSQPTLERLDSLREQFRQQLAEVGFTSSAVPSNRSSGRDAAVAAAGGSNSSSWRRSGGGGGEDPGKAATGVTAAAAAVARRGEEGGPGLQDPDLNSGNMALVQSVLVAGLYPHVAAFVRPDRQSKTRQVRRPLVWSGGGGRGGMNSAAGVSLLCGARSLAVSSGCAELV